MNCALSIETTMERYGAEKKSFTIFNNSEASSSPMKNNANNDKAHKAFFFVVIISSTPLETFSLEFEKKT